MKKRVLILGIVGLVIGLFVFDYFVHSPWGVNEIPVISTVSFMVMMYGFVARDKPKHDAPVPTPSSSVPVCQTCGGPLEFIQQYNRWYCWSCKKYA